MHLKSALYFWFLQITPFPFSFFVRNFRTNTFNSPQPTPERTNPCIILHLVLSVAPFLPSLSFRDIYPHSLSPSLCQRPPTLHHIHGRDRRNWGPTVLRGDLGRQRDPANPDGAAEPDGRVWPIGAGQVHHGDQQTRRSWPRPPQTRQTGQEDWWAEF